jgi:hypothetical protein
LSVQLKDLHRRSIALDTAVVLAAVGGAATCAAVLVMFLGALREATIGNVLFGLFGLAVVCALCAIAAYTVEMLLAGIGIRTPSAVGNREWCWRSARIASGRRRWRRRNRQRWIIAARCCGTSEPHHLEVQHAAGACEYVAKPAFDDQIRTTRSLGVDTMSVLLVTFLGVAAILGIAWLHWGR